MLPDIIVASNASVVKVPSANQSSSP